MLSVTAVEEVTESLVGAVHRLLPQLSSSARLPSGAEVSEIVSSPATTLFVAKLALGDGHAGAAIASDEERTSPQEPEGDTESGSQIVGMLTLVVFRIPTGVRAWVEDVVVDQSVRGQGVGGALIRAAVERAMARGAVTVDLTSRPSRQAANRLYQQSGFQLRQTSVYRFKLGG